MKLFTLSVQASRCFFYRAARGAGCVTCTCRVIRARWGTAIRRIVCPCFRAIVRAGGPAP